NSLVHMSGGDSLTLSIMSFRASMVEHQHHLDSTSRQRVQSDGLSCPARLERGLSRIPESHDVELPAVVRALPADESIRVVADRVDIDDARQRIEQAYGITHRRR